jgi:hypothetical protein
LDLTNNLSHPLLAEVLASQVMRFADNYAFTVAQATDELSDTLPTPQAKLEAVRWKLGQATAAFINASGPNPALNALDLVVLATVSRMVLEDEVHRVYGPAALPLLETHRRLETNAWAAVNRVLKPAQQQELRDMIDQWRLRNPSQRYVATTRFRELAEVLGKMRQEGPQSAGSIFGLLYLDPFAGLDPTAQAIEETRQLAERAMYYSQRMPMLLNWQVQVLTFQLTAQPDVKQVLEEVARVTRSTEAFAQLADRVPQLLTEQRQAAIQQLLDGLQAERTNFLAGLASQEQKTGSLLAEARQTLEAGNDMALSAQSTVQELREFVSEVSPHTTNATPGRPFDVREYGATAAQVGMMAKDLQNLLAGVNQSLPELQHLQQQAVRQTAGLLYQAFWLGLALIFVLLPGAVLAGLAFQRLAAKRKISPPSAGLDSPVPTNLGDLNKRSVSTP